MNVFDFPAAIWGENWEIEREKRQKQEGKRDKRKREKKMKLRF